MIQASKFGTCCKDLSDAMRLPKKSFFHIQGNDVLYLSVGYVQVGEVQGIFDSAVLFCPFCGKQLQTREEISKNAPR